MRFLTTNLIVIMWLLIAETHLSHTLSPVVIVSGFLVSKIRGKITDKADNEFISRCRPISPNNGNFLLWLEPTYVLERSINCVFDALKLNYNIKTHKTSNRRGVVTQISDFGGTESVSSVDDEMLLVVFGNLIKYLETQGYKRNKSIRGAPYDWRKGPNELDSYYKMLKTLIEETYRINDNQKVTIIAYSYGSIVVQQFLKTVDKEWKNKYIYCLITLGGTFGGTVTIMDLYSGGLEFLKIVPSSPSFDLNNLAAKIAPTPTSIKNFVGTLPSILSVFPSPYIYQSRVLAQTTTRTYTANDIKDFVRDIRGNTAVQMYKDVFPYQVDLNGPGVKLHCLCGSNVPTIAKINYLGETSNSTQGVPSFGTGDGLVNDIALEFLCKKWMNEKKSDTTLTTFPGANHLGIVNDPRVFVKITEILNEAK